MSYKLLVPSACIFIPSFYEQLVRHRDVSTAVHYARQVLVSNKQRTGILKSTIDLPDAIVPVMYLSATGNVNTTPQNNASNRDSAIFIAKVTQNVGMEAIASTRDLDLLRVETLLTSQSHVLELLGEIGQGKSSFIRSAIAWWRETGFIDSVIWIDCESNGKLLKSRDLEDLKAVIDAETTRALNAKSKSTVEKSSKSRRFMLVVDHSERVLINASQDDKVKFSKFIAAIEDFYVLVPLYKAARATLDFPPLSLLPLNDIAALELAMSFISIPKVLKDEHSETMYLRGSVSLLGHNPLAMECAFFGVHFKDNYLPRHLFEDLQLPSRKHQLLRSVASSRILPITKDVLNQMTKPSERILFFSLGRARLLLRKDSTDLIKALVYSENLKTDTSLIEDRTYSGYVGLLMTDKRFKQQMKAEFGIEAYFDKYLQFSPYRREFETVVKLLEQSGLIRSMDKGYWRVHPLLSYAISILAYNEDKKGADQIFAAFSSSYRIMAQSWDTTKLYQFWAITPVPALISDSWRYHTVTDFANCMTAVYGFLHEDAKTWPTSFPWVVLLGLGIHFCSLFGPDIPEFQKVLIFQLLTRFLHKWNKVGDIRKGILKGFAILEYSNMRPRENGGSEMGFMTAVLVSMFIFRYHSVKYNSVVTTKSWHEVQRLWRELCSYAPMTAETPRVLDILCDVAFLRGCVALSSPPLETRRQEFIADISKMDSEMTLHLKLEDIFDSGVADSVEVSLAFSPLTPAELEEIEPDEDDDDSKSSPGRERHAIEIKKLTDNIANDVAKIGENAQNGNAITRVVSVDERYEGLSQRPKHRQPKYNALQAKLMTRLIQNQLNEDVNDTIAGHLALAQRMMFKNQLPDSQEQYKIAVSLLYEQNPRLCHVKDAKDKTGVFLCAVLLQQANVESSLGNNDAAKSILLRLQELTSGKDTMPMQRQILLYSYYALDHLGFYDHSESTGVHTEEQIRGFIEWGSLRFDRSLAMPEYMISHMRRNERALEAQTSDFDISQVQETDGAIFSALFYRAMFNFDEVVKKFARLDDDAFGFLPEARKVTRLCFKMLLADKLDVEVLFQRVALMIIENFLRGDSKSNEEKEQIYEKIFVEAETVLFGDVDRCNNLELLTKYKGKPIGKKPPWETWIQWAARAHGTPAQRLRIAKKIDRKLVSAART